MKATSGEPERPAPLRPLAVAPLLIVASIAAWAISDTVGSIGPFDKAKIGWAIVVPLFLLAPGAAAVASRRSGWRAGWLAAVAIGIALAAATVLTLMWKTTFVDCQPVTDSLVVAFRAIPVGLAAGASFIVAAATGLALVERSVLAAVAAALVTGAIGAATTLLVFLAAFPVLSCAYVPS